MLLASGHDVVIVDPDEEQLDSYRDELDCGLVSGDGTRPSVMCDVSPKNSDFLFCLGDSDQRNIITALVGRAVGFRRIVTKIDDPDFEQVCVELDLQDTILPQEEVAEALVDLVSGRQRAALSISVSGRVRFYAFKVPGEMDGERAEEVDLGKHTRPIAANRRGKEESEVVEQDTKLHRDDELVVVTHESELERLRESYGPKLKQNHSVRSSDEEREHD